MAKISGTKVRILPQRSDVRLAELVAKTIVASLSPESILDIGCGDGVVQHSIQEACRYRGLDISEACIYEQTQENPNIFYVRPDEVVQQMKAGAPWDTILLLDVLEHTRGFTPLFESALENATRHVIVSLPNELFILDRFRMLQGRELNAHSLDLIKMPEGFKHQYIVNIKKARQILQQVAKANGFTMSGETFRPLVARNRMWQPALAALRKLCSDQIWSMGSIFVFERNR